MWFGDMKTHIRSSATLWIPCVLLFIFRLAHFLLEVPVVRMIEYAICEQRLGDQLVNVLVVDESVCKTDFVQNKVSSVLGWRISFDSIPGVLSVLYYGDLAEKYGHCNILSICCIGYTLALLWTLTTCFYWNVFPIQLVWLAACCLLLGGGSLVFNSMMTSFLSHLSEPRFRSKRLFILAAMPHMAKLISPPMATALLAQSIYLPSIISGCLVILCAILLQFARIYLKSEELDISEGQLETNPLLNDGYQPLDVSMPASSSPMEPPSEAAEEIVQGGTTMTSGQITCMADDMYGMTQKLCALLRSFIAAACNVSDLMFACAVFFLIKNAVISENFMFQYFSERFGRPLRDTTILRFAWSSGAFMATFCLAPTISTALSNRNTSKSVMELSIARVSTILSLLCFFIAWRASDNTVFILSMLGAGLGQALDPALQSLLSSGISSENTGRLISCMYMGILLGDTTGGPLMSVLVSIGRSSTSSSSGYNFLASAIIFGIIGLVTINNPLLAGRDISQDE